MGELFDGNKYCILPNLFLFHILADDYSLVSTAASAHHHCGIHQVKQWMLLKDMCGNSLVLEREANGIDMELWLRMKVTDELACYALQSDGSDGCHIAFVVKEYMVGEKG